MRKSGKPTSIGDLLGKLIDDLGVRRRIEEEQVIEAWSEICGQQVLHVTSGAWMKRGRLFVQITSSPWRHELHMQREVWRDRLNGHLGRDAVREIVFR